MSQHPQEEPFSEVHLNSPEYRERLMRKLNCLIAVLEVATAKVRKSLAGPSADTERLVRISTNLQSTLDVCLRARAALERRDALPAELPENLTQVIEDARPGREGRASHRSLPRGARYEFSDRDEAEKFELMGPIDPRTIEDCDLEDLMRKLQG